VAFDPSNYTFTKLTQFGDYDPPTLYDINNKGEIIGETGVKGILLRNGVVTDVIVPGAVRTIPQGINDKGDIVGTYTDPDFSLHGFLYSQGDYTQLDIPGAGRTDVTGINNRGQIVAFAADGGTATEPGGYIYEKGEWSKIEVINDPDAFLVPDGINNRGVIVGSTSNEAFVLEGGQLTLVDNPLSEFYIDFRDINNQGQVAGTLAPFARSSSGFVYDDGEVTTIGPPRPTDRPTQWTINGINDAGALVGNFDNRFRDEQGDPTGNYAFIATPKVAQPPKPAQPAVDWNELAARVEANFAATGKWFIPDDISVPEPAEPAVDWNALAAQVEANFAATGKWFL
jgi:probable HAF family extracellular repeat protein